MDHPMFRSFANLSLQEQIDAENQLRTLMHLWMENSLRHRQEALQRGFHKLVAAWVHDKNNKYGYKIEEFIKNTLPTLPNSGKIARTSQQKKTIRELLLGPKETHGLYHKLNENELDLLSANVIIKICDEKSILFLQGHPGNHSYIVISGGVELYFEESKEKEVYIRQRVTSVTIPNDRSCEFLGVYLKTLNPGSLFGDLVLISETGQSRSCAAVAIPNTLLFVIDVETYNASVRPYRVTESQLSVACDLLRDSVLFSHYTEAKIKNIAYNMFDRVVAPKTTIASAGQAVNSVYLILSGDVRMYPYEYIPPDQKPDIRMARVPIAQLGRGCIIGEKEMMRKLAVFQMTYIAATRCQLFEMDSKTFDYYACSEKMRVAEIFTVAKLTEELREEFHMKRLMTSKVVLKSMAQQSNQQLYKHRKQMSEKQMRRGLSNSTSNEYSNYYPNDNASSYTAGDYTHSFDRDNDDQSVASYAASTASHSASTSATNFHNQRQKLYERAESSPMSGTDPGHSLLGANRIPISKPSKSLPYPDLERTQSSISSQASFNSRSPASTNISMRGLIPLVRTPPLSPSSASNTSSVPPAAAPYHNNPFDYKAHSKSNHHLASLTTREVYTRSTGSSDPSRTSDTPDITAVQTTDMNPVDIDDTSIIPASSAPSTSQLKNISTSTPNLNHYNSNKSLPLYSLGTTHNVRMMFGSFTAHLRVGNLGSASETWNAVGTNRNGVHTELDARDGGSGNEEMTETRGALAGDEVGGHGDPLLVPSPEVTTTAVTAILMSDE